jgi:hypothetical protein
VMLREVFRLMSCASPSIACRCCCWCCHM